MKWYLGAILVLLVGLVLQLGLLVYAMYVLLGILLVSRYLAREWIENVSARRECSRLTAEIGDKVAVIVTVRNNGRLPIPWLLLQDALPKQALLQKPPRLKVEKRRLKIVRLPGGGETKILFQVNLLMRGYYQLGPLLVESGDLFGLHRRYRVLTEPHFVLVFPKVLPLMGYDLASRRPIGEVRMTHRLFEDPSRISGVRRYENGDPLNRIHWKATARTGELHSKTFEPSSVAGITFLLDFHTDSYTARGEPHRSELAITAVATLANAVYQLGQQVGFISNGRDAVDRISEEGWKQEFHTREAAHEMVEKQSESDRLRPVAVETRRGSDQLIRILETLARVEFTDGLTFSELVMETASRLPRDATVVAILPAVSPESAIALGNLKKQGYAVTAVLVTYKEEDCYPESIARLMAEGIDARSIEDESELTTLCSAQMVR